MRGKTLVIGAVLVTVAVAVSAQSQRAAATLDDVVSELRGLRADMKAMRATTTQAQLLTVRLQLQEQRIAVLSNQRQLVVTKLTEETRQRIEAEAQLQRFQVNDAKNLPLEMPRDQLQFMIDEFKRVAALHRDAEQQLRAEEARLSAEIANEQNRWQEFNGRLDELERSLK
jgi:hypothetical protein